MGMAAILTLCNIPLFFLFYKFEELDMDSLSLNQECVYDLNICPARSISVPISIYPREANLLNAIQKTK